jgi:hypothetical protein
MSNSNKIVLGVGLLLFALLVGSLMYAERHHCGGRGCIPQNVHPSVTR